MNRRIVSVAGIGLAACLSGGVALAQSPSSDNPSGSAGGSPTSSVGEVMRASGTVQKVDMEKRDISLKDNRGEEFVVNVPEDVTRLDAVKKGDRVTLTYKQSLALSLKKAGEAMAPGETEMAARKPGALPGGMAGRQITASAKVTKVDPSNNKLTIRTADGTTDTINVTDPQIQADMKQIKVGDKIQATYTEAVAMSVTPKNKE
jgi:Cu/Ag efflux protein CusF